MPSALFFRTLIALSWTVALAWHGRGATTVLLIAAIALLWAVPLLRSATVRPARAAAAEAASPRG
ncbi:hypothetical protein [Symbioplanes lichenis]|uniref:hypothetical protein n=1 Tax=Symbioplanes lichenis TaxID=1629072 RepID=UPI0027387F82|nr:hypothetical protein [Actinoplanes lichenis]